MKLFNYPEAKQVIVSGDIHGDFRSLVFKLCIRYGCKDTVLIVAAFVPARRPGILRS